jgi:hypothetical protein
VSRVKKVRFAIMFKSKVVKKRYSTRDGQKKTVALLVPLCNQADFHEAETFFE